MGCTNSPSLYTQFLKTTVSPGMVVDIYLFPYMNRKNRKAMSPSHFNVKMSVKKRQKKKKKKKKEAKKRELQRPFWLDKGKPITSNNFLISGSLFAYENVSIHWKALARKFRRFMFWFWFIFYFIFCFLFCFVFCFVLFCFLFYFFFILFLFFKSY